MSYICSKAINNWNSEDVKPDTRVMNSNFFCHLIIFKIPTTMLLLSVKQNEYPVMKEKVAEFEKTSIFFTDFFNWIGLDNYGSQCGTLFDCLFML